jgi:3-phenylpropionate/trans-cinnamate dioxygenase ferredoxin component
MSFARACGLAELEDGKPLAVTLQDVDIAVVRDEDDVYAIRDRCSHAEIPLSEGDVDGCLIECWLHGSTFDLRTGKPTNLPATEPVATFPVEVRGADVYVDTATTLNGVTPD